MDDSLSNRSAIGQNRPRLGLEFDIIQETKRFHELHQRMSGQTKRIHALASARVRGNDHRFLIFFCELVKDCEQACQIFRGVDILFSMRADHEIASRFQANSTQDIGIFDPFGVVFYDFPHWTAGFDNLIGGKALSQ